MDFEKNNSEKALRLFLELIDTKLDYLERRASARLLAETISDYLLVKYIGNDEHLTYDLANHKDKFKKHNFSIKINILNYFNKFPKKLTTGIIFIQKESSNGLHNDVYAKNQDGEITYIDLLALSSFPIVVWFFYEELKCNPDELKINELIIDYKKNHLNYSEKIVYENNFDMDKIIEELKKQNVAIKNNVNPVITNNNEISPVTNVIINNEGHKNVDFIPIKYILVIIGTICLIFLMFIIFKQSNFSFIESEHKTKNMPPVNDSSSNLNGIIISNYGNEVKSTVYGNIENSKDEKK